MRLVKLLAAGKSVMGLKGPGSPYRLTDQRLLPKFGTEKEPRCAAARPAGRGPRPAERAPAAGTVPAAACLNPAPAVAGTSGRAARESKLGRVRRWLSGRLGRLWARPGPMARKPAMPRFGRSAIQGELSLERVKVVRNDLSDADVQFVQLGSPAGQESPSLPGLESSLPSEAGRARRAAGLAGAAGA